jgi:hypothetical protein
MEEVDQWSRVELKFDILEWKKKAWRDLSSSSTKLHYHLLNDVD